MDAPLDAEIAELRRVHKGLTGIADDGSEFLLSGALPFDASGDGLVPITDSFEIELIIPHSYPKLLPRARETGGKIDKSYSHVHTDGTLCLAVPIEERRIFFRQPSLLGFVNRLLIPYFYGYCYWNKFGEHPFGEQDHGPQGIVQYYCEALNLKDEAAALAVLSWFLEFGYRGHHLCPCGSGSIVRRCHGKALRGLYELHTKHSLARDFEGVLRAFLDVEDVKKRQISDVLRRQVLRILDSRTVSGSSGSIQST